MHRRGCGSSVSTWTKAAVLHAARWGSWPSSWVGDHLFVCQSHSHYIITALPILTGGLSRTGLNWSRTKLKLAYEEMTEVRHPDIARHLSRVPLTLPGGALCGLGDGSPGGLTGALPDARWSHHSPQPSLVGPSLGLPQWSGVKWHHPTCTPCTQLHSEAEGACYTWVGRWRWEVQRGELSELCSVVGAPPCDRPARYATYSKRALRGTTQTLDTTARTYIPHYTEGIFIWFHGNMDERATVQEADKDGSGVLDLGEFRYLVSKVGERPDHTALYSTRTGNYYNTIEREPLEKCIHYACTRRQARLSPLTSGFRRSIVLCCFVLFLSAGEP